MSITLVIVALYFCVLLAFGLFASRKLDSVSDFYVAGKKLGYWVSAFSSRATGESGWLLLGLTGMGWAVGVNAFWVLLGQVAGETMSWIYVARPFKRLTDRYHSITVPDYLESRFNDRRHTLRWIASVVILTMVTSYLAAQLTATGKAFREFLDLDFSTGAALGLTIVLFYTIIGGFRAVAWSDLFQGIMMVFGLILVPTVAIVNAGGIDGMIQQLSAADPGLLKAMGGDGLTTAGILTVIGFIGPGFGYLGSPQLYARFIAVSHERKLIPGAVVAVLFTIVTSGGAILAGMAGRVLYPGIADQETIFPLLSHELFGPLLSGLMIAVVLAAVMSTADSLLILAVSSVVRDIYQRIFRPDATQRRVVMLSRILTLIIAAFALVVALLEVRVIFWFVLFAWAGISSAFCPVIVLSVFWRRLTLRGAAAAMVVGFLTAVIWSRTLGDVLYEMVPGVALAFVAGIVVSLLDKKPAPQPEQGAPAPTEEIKVDIGK
ncbi:MAG: High-affinity proline transporter PutP [Calditrichaeota bacterium]|nr:High-affinity proline transporter PutP [Calditrichota bacterium]